MTKSILLVGVVLALVACNTVEGIGEDISGGARAVNNAF